MKQHPSRADGTERAVDALIAAVAAKQSGIISVAQLHALGLSDSEIAWRVRTARLHRVHRGVYAVGHPRITDHAHLVAALLATGPAAF